MKSKNTSIDRLSTATLRQAQSEMAMMQSDLRKLRDSVSNMSRSIGEPVIRAKRTKTKKTTNTPIWTDLAGMGLAVLSESGLLGDTVEARENVNIGGYTSNAQSSTRATNAFSLSTRIR